MWRDDDDFLERDWKKENAQCVDESYKASVLKKTLSILAANFLVKFSVSPLILTERYAIITFAVLNIRVWRSW